MEKSFNERLLEKCKITNNRLCIGLDIDPDKLPSNISDFESMEIFIKEVIDSTIDFCPVYKPNLAFYERFGSKGFILLENIANYIGDRAITIADGKRGDIGNTSRQYARGILQTMGCDAITISPYMGRDAIEPFLEDFNKGVFVLAMTSNDGAAEIQNNPNTPSSASNPIRSCGFRAGSPHLGAAQVASTRANPKMQ